MHTSPFTEIFRPIEPVAPRSKSDKLSLQPSDDRSFVRELESVRTDEPAKKAVIESAGTVEQKTDKENNGEPNPYSNGVDNTINTPSTDDQKSDIATSSLSSVLQGATTDDVITELTGGSQIELQNLISSKLLLNPKHAQHLDSRSVVPSGKSAAPQALTFKVSDVPLHSIKTEAQAEIFGTQKASADSISKHQVHQNMQSTVKQAASHYITHASFGDMQALFDEIDTTKSIHELFTTKLSVGADANMSISNKALELFGQKLYEPVKHGTPDQTAQTDNQSGKNQIAQVTQLSTTPDLSSINAHVRAIMERIKTSGVDSSTDKKNISAKLSTDDQVKSIGLQQQSQTGLELKNAAVSQVQSKKEYISLFGERQRDLTNIAHSTDNQAAEFSLDVKDAGSLKHTDIAKTEAPARANFILPEKFGQMIKSGSHSITLKLSPESLGEAQLRLHVVADKVSGTLFVESHSAKAAVEASMDKLVQRLSNEGLTLDNLDVEVSSQWQEQTESQWGALAQRQRRTAGERFAKMMQSVTAPVETIMSPRGMRDVISSSHVNAWA